MISRGFAFGNNLIIPAFHSGFGFYIENIPEQLRPAMTYDEDGELETFPILYRGTVIKLPFFQIEFTSFSVLSDEVSQILDSQAKETAEMLMGDKDDN